MSLLDRGKRAVDKDESREPSEPAAPHRPSDKPVELAAAIAQHSARPSNNNDLQLAGQQARRFLHGSTSRAPAAGQRSHAAGRSAFGRIAYVGFALLACFAIAAAIGSTGSFLVASLAFALAAISALLVVVDRPRSLRALYARLPGTATGLHAAIIIGALAAWGGVQTYLQELRVRAATRAEEEALKTAKKSAELQQRVVLNAQASNTTLQLRALAAQARAAVQAKDWKRVAAVLKQAVVIEKPYKEGDATIVLDREVLRELEAVAAQAADQQHRDQAQQAEAKLRALVAKAQAAKAAGQWTEVQAASDEAGAVQQAYDSSDERYPLDRSLGDRAAALSEEARMHVAEQKAQREAQTRVAQLQQALAQAEQLLRARRWKDADNVLQALLAAVDGMSPSSQAQLPASFSLASVRAQVRQLAAEAHGKLPRKR
jgi:hypothetical protein